MINKAPSAVPSLDPDQHPNEPTKAEPLTTRPKAAFQWPPDCVWPFTDHKGTGDA
jgi:hypothetical protein